MSNTDQGAGPVATTGSWMSDVQRALALILVATFSIALMVITFRLVIWGDPPTLVDLLKTLISALINVVMLVLGYFYGSSKAKEQSDTSQQRIVDKLTSTAPGTLPPSPPGQPTAPVIAWWSKLSDAEKNAITVDDDTDARTRAIVTAMTAGSATPDDLAYLVSKGLLTQARADAIKS